MYLNVIDELELILSYFSRDRKRARRSEERNDVSVGGSDVAQGTSGDERRREKDKDRREKRDRDKGKEREKERDRKRSRRSRSRDRRDKDK